MDKAIKLPIRCVPTERIVISENINQLDVALKQLMRVYCKKDPIYHYPIDLGLDKPMTVKDDEGKIIEINNIGKWLFGTPGYKGNAVFESFTKENVVVRIPKLEEKTSELIIKLLKNGYEAFHSSLLKSDFRCDVAHP